MVSDYSGKHNDMAGRLATLALNGTAHTPAENSTFPSSRVSPFATSLLIPLLACAEPVCASHRGSASSFQQKKDKQKLVPFLSMAGLSWICSTLTEFHFRASPCPFNLFAIRTRYTTSVRKSAPPSRGEI